MTTETTEPKPKRRRPAPTGKKRGAPIKGNEWREMTITLEPDLYDWIKGRPPGSAKAIIRRAYIEAHIV